MMKRKYTLGQLLMFGLSLFFIVSSGVLAFQINADIEHAVQTVKRIIVTSDGTEGGTILMELNPEGASNGETEMLKIKGNMIVGEVDGPMTNKAEGQYSSVGGGQANLATGEFSNIGGGERNKSYGLHSTVGGGDLNQAYGNKATVPGGHKNKAYGISSLAAGYKAEALHDGTFVRSDMSSIFSTFESSTGNQFLIRSAGGVGINTNDTRFGSLNISAVGPLNGLALYAGSDILARLFFLSNNNFYIARAFSDTAGIVIDQEGDVGIGNMEPSAGLRLDVEGKIGANEYCDSDGGNCLSPTQSASKSYVNSHRLKNTSYNTESAITDLCHGTETKSSLGSNFDVCFLSYSHVEEGGICRVRQTSYKERKVEAICNGASHYAKCGMYCMNMGQD